MNRLEASNFSLKATIESGQLFRHFYSNGCYYIVVGDSLIKVQQEGNRLLYDCSSNSFDVKKFLGLKHNYGEIMQSINRDKNIAAAIKKHRGLRILEQDLWECTASFICSSFSNIPRIKQCIEKVAAAFGEKIEFDGFTTFSFPQPHQINDFSRLKKCGLGYRVKYLFETAKIFAGISDFSPQHNSACSGMCKSCMSRIPRRRAEDCQLLLTFAQSATADLCNRTMSDLQLRKLSYEDAKAKIMELPGVGSKVADCILLFSCGFFEAFPVDVWIQRVMEKNYGGQMAAMAAARGSRTGKLNEKVVGDFARGYFGKYAGYAQQFLYHNAKTQKKPAKATAYLTK